MKQRINQLENAGQSNWRERLFPYVWGLLFPIRIYLKYFPVQRGKGVLLRHIVRPLLPPADAEFALGLPGGACIALRYRETLGLSSLLYGTFELAELEFAKACLRPADNVMDIGANVGIFSVLMGSAIGDLGRLLAFEPVPHNVERLQRNLERNRLQGAKVVPCALGDVEGRLTLHLATDPAYPSLLKVESGLADGNTISVDVRRLDGIWEDAGRPKIAFVKMDVEGAEAAVIRGASRFLEGSRPIMLIEANSMDQLDILRCLLDPFGYKVKQPAGFAPHNYIFFHPVAADRLPA